MKINYQKYRIFHIFWCLFIVTHHLISSTSWIHIGNEWLNPSHEVFRVFAVLTTFCVVVSIIKPKNILWFVLTLIFWSLLKIDNLPHVPNHIILALIVNFTILSGIFYTRNCIGNIEERLGKIYQLIAPVIRWSLIILYFFTVFHKLNWDFFDVNVSCAVNLYNDISNRIPFIPSNEIINWSVIIGTLLIETLIPILLIIPKTRLKGIIIGLTFHLILSLHPNFYITSFSAEITALFVLFLPDTLFFQIVSLSKKWQKSLRKFTSRSHLSKRIGLKIMIIALSLFLIFLMLNSKFDLLVLFKNLYRLFWYFISLCFIIFLLNSIRDDKIEKNLFYIQKSILIIFPFIIFVNGISPYLGVKTATNFSMFSNLKIIEDTSNNIFFPKILELTSYNSDLVEIIESNDVELQQFIINKEFITYFELQRWVQKQNDSNQTKTIYIRNNQIVNLDMPFDKKKSIYNELSWLEKKFLIYRSIPMEGPCNCQW